MISILSRVGVSARRLQAAASAIAADIPAAELAASWQIIHDRDQIGHLLRYLLETAQPVTLTCQNQQRVVRTRLVGVDCGAEAHLLIEATADASAHADLLREGRVNLGSRFLELPVVCAVELAGVVEAGGKSCYRAALPQWLLFSEMRDSRRAQLPETALARLSWSMPGQPRCEAHVIDISEGGIGLWLPQRTTSPPSVGERWEATLLCNAGGAGGTGGDSSDCGEAISLDLARRHLSPHRNGGYRLGAAIQPLTEADRQRLTRLIVRHEMLFAEAG